MARKKKIKKKINWKGIRWGSLTRWLKKHRAKIKRRYGEDPFVTRKGKIVEINDKVLRKLYKDVDFIKELARSHWKRIRRKIQFKIYVLKR